MKKRYFCGPFRPFALACTSLFGLTAAHGEKTLHYTFENVNDVMTDTVTNLGSVNTNGEFMNPEKLSITNGAVVTVNGTSYLLGKVLNLANADSETSSAGHVDTGLPPADFGMTTEDGLWTRDYTAMAWVNFGSTTGDNMIFGQLSSQDSVHLGSRNGFLHSGHWGDDIGPDQGVNIPTGTGEWHHVAFVNQGQQQSIFWDGVLVAGPGAGGVPGNPNTLDNLLIGTFTNNGSFVGSLDEVKVFGDHAMTAEEIQAEMIAGLPVFTLATLSRSILTNDGYRFELTDSPGSVVNPATVTLTIDGAAVTPQVEKNGDVTVVTYVPATPVGPGLTSNYVLAAKDNTNADIGGSGTVRAPYLPKVIPGPEGAVGSWGMREYRPGSIDPDSLEAAVALLLELPPADDDPDDPTVVDATSVPVVNHSDPDAPGGRGNFNNDLPLIGDQEGEDDNEFVIIAKTKVEITDINQDYTFAIHSDDGFALRISGGPDGNTSAFVSSTGNGSIDGSDPQTLVHVAPTGDSNTRGVYRFSAPGTYDVVFVAYEIGGGAFWEVAWAPGAHAADRDTTWALLGNPNDPAVTAIPFEPKFPTEFPGPAGTDGNWGIRTWLEADEVDNLGQTMDFLSFTDRTPQNDPNNTIDVQRPYLNARDPQTNGHSGFIVPDDPHPGEIEGSDEDRVVTVAKGRIQVTTPGDYTFSVRSDDGFLLRFKAVEGPNPAFQRVSRGNPGDGNGRFEMSNPNEMFYEAGTGDSDTRGVIFLDAGLYDVEFVNWEGAGGFFYELAVAHGAHPHGSGTSPIWAPVGGTATAVVLVPGIAEPGWTVESSTPDRDEYSFSIEGAEMAIDATLADNSAPAEKTSVWDAINFTDPEAGADGSFTPNAPWPLNTPDDDDNYAMRASANLVITTAGRYHLGFQGDDGGYLIIEGPGNPQWSEIVFSNHPNDAFIEEAVPGSGINNMIRLELGTGNSRTIGSIDLQPGTYTLRSLVYEGGGGSWWEIFGGQEAAPGAYQVYDLLTKGPERTLTAGLPLVGESAQPPSGSFRITEVSVSGNGATVSLTFPSEPGVTYNIQASAGTGPWVAAGSVAATGVETTAQVNLADIPALSGSSRGFFRVVKP